MDDTCKYCGSGKAVPVLDKRIENSPKPGNKYRAACLAEDCQRWLPLASEEEFRAHPRPHVLPADAGSDDVHRVIPLEEYDYGEEWASLAESAGQRAMTDGGDDTVDEPENRFTCPSTGCEAEVEGKPDECPECGAGYNW